MTEVEKVKKTMAARTDLVKWGLIVAVIVVLLSLPFWSENRSAMNIIILIFSYLALGEMWNFMGGYAGLNSLGQQCFVGIGGFTMAILLQNMNQPLVVSLMASFVVCVIFALAIAAPLFKMSGVYFTIATCILSQCVYAWCGNWSVVNYNAGISISKAFHIPFQTLYLWSVGIGLLSVFFVYGILRTKTGMGMMAMRDNPEAAEIRGVKLFRNKLLALLISSGITGVAGGVIYLNLAYIKTDNAFSMNWTIACIFMVIIGGVGTIEGPIIGAVLYIILRQLLYQFTGISMIILGAIAVVVIIVMPQGIMGVLHRRFRFELFSVRRAVKKRS